ncbi:rhomboid family intramembrane serine protease [Afifella sp. H1R]|uniref:rhomboid family intramembrane serine protease n=1 Tax=Afifella sp. H1R TaxID=2908841 RepID=UPI001F3E05EC|nr:rhomboid family intramembrane serine protease [Afifella sp. H1R]MCF1505287.1 rhomboid family intramembrane serine protease [Afifella sp. H1R]
MFLPLHDANPLGYIRRPYVNWSIIAITAACFVLTGGLDSARVEMAALSLGLIPSVVNDIAELPPSFVLIPEELSFITYAFLHGNLIHLGGNMLFLWIFGDNIEDALGHLRYLAFYLLGAAGSGYIYTLANPASEAPLIGASGAVAAIVGGYLILHPKVKLWVLAFGRIPLRLPAFIVLGAWLVFQIANLAMSTPESSNIGWWAHIGGFALGAALVVPLRRRGVPLFDRDLPR